jgi:hypothetical protein
MAAGDFTIRQNSLNVEGNKRKITADCEVDNTKRAFGIVSGWIHDVSCSSPDDACVVEVDVNENAAGIETAGAVSITSGLATVNTVAVTVTYVS